MTTTVDREFAAEFLKSVDDPGSHGVHILFNQFWRYAPDEVVTSYQEQFNAIEACAAHDESRHYPEPTTLERLESCPDGSLGAALHEFIVANGLEENLAINYRVFHKALEDNGMLDGMPEQFRYTVLRGFQLHDYLHTLTGYGSSPMGEIGLQAFCLAQTRFPYFSMWVAVTTSRMTFVDPSSIEPLMDAITGGWQYGRSVANIQLEDWEKRLDEPLADLRVEYGLPPDGWDGFRREQLGSLERLTTSRRHGI